MSSSESFLHNPNRAFSHVYIEEAVLVHPVTQRILSRIATPSIIRIRHYKDVFCRKNQAFDVQRNAPLLIIARKTDSFLYKGSPMCDPFGHADFFYTSDVMNCIYQCEYCYLQGLYPSANLVVFVNLEDTFCELEKRLRDSRINVSISYDTDLLGLEPLTGFVKDWVDFATAHPDAVIELRTKSANFSWIAAMPPPPNFILAWSLSPEQIANSFEKRVPPLAARLCSMKQAIGKGWKVRLCVDPMIHVEDWEDVYDTFSHTVREALPVERLYDISIGVFRVPKDSLKTMRAVQSHSKLLAYPFSLTETGWSYADGQKQEMARFLTQRFAALGYKSP